MDIPEAQKKLISIVAVVVIAAIADLFFVVRPLASKSFATFGKIRSVKADLAAAEDPASSLEGTRKRLGALKKENEQYSKKFSRKDEVPFLTSGLYKIAVSSGVRIASVRPTQEDPASAKAAYQKTMLIISATGDYRQIGRFIEKLESSDKLMVIKDIEIVWDESTPRSNNFTLSVCLYTVQ